MINSIMEEGERKTLSKIPDSQSQTSTIYSSAANGKPADSARKAGHGAGNSGVGASEGFADIASKIFSSKVKGQVTSKMDTCDRKHNKQNGCDDDLPLGSEAHSLSLDHGTDRKYPPPEDTRSKWRRATSQGIMGWQSFNSDVSNQTSASSASLEQLLNDRQVDPEQMLMSLGFGGEHQNAVPTLARVPARFLHHPSRAYGIIPPGCTEEEEEEEEEDVVDDTGAAVHVPDKSSTSAANNTTSSTTSSSAVVPHNRKRSGIWTLARTLSLLRMRTTPSRGHMSPTSNSSGTQPLTNHPVSILHPANQQYLASKGFYEKQGWPKGTFVESDGDSLHAVKEEVESKDAASKRKIFKRTRPHRNWSICDSEENEAFSAGGEWVTKSVDDARSREDLTGQDDSLGRGTYFSTTTESSTDSLDTPNLETERAFEKIRREYHARNRQEHSSSDDLFLPCRKKRSSSDAADNNENDSDHGLDLLTNYFVSPASSRQTTVEKAPSISQYDDGHVDTKRLEEDGHNQVTTYSSNTVIKRVNPDPTNHFEDVHIIISSSENNNGKYWLHDVRQPAQGLPSSRLTVNSAQTTSSDSGSSSSATAVGSSMTLTAEDNESRLVNEFENNISDWNYESRTNGAHDSSHGPDAVRYTVSNSCQTTENDFNMAAAVAANQNVNVTTLNTSNRSHLQIRISRSGIHSPVRDLSSQDYTYVEQSPRVQLSTLPSTISHLELMKRLQHSQNELSRMGSVQSDSSGFGDADPAVAEPESLKRTSLGSNIESYRMLASNASTTNPILSVPHTVEMATQTSADKIKTSREMLLGTGSDPTLVRSSEQGHHYVTLCYIPTLTSKRDRTESLRQTVGRNAGVIHPLGSHPDGSSVCRSRSGSEPSHPHFVYNESLSRRKYWPNTADDHDSSAAHNINNNREDNKSLHLGQDQLYSYFNPHSINSHSDNSHDSDNRYQQTDHNYDMDWQAKTKPRISNSEKNNSGSHKTFTSQIQLYSHEGSFSRKHGSSNSNHLHRNTDTGITKAGNNTPLSAELTFARVSAAMNHPKPVHSSHFTTSVMTTVSATNTTTPYHSSDVTSSNSSSLTHDSTTSSGLPLLAGNISGLRTHFSTKPLDFYQRTSLSTSRQRSCDILDDNFESRDSVTSPSSSRLSDDTDTFFSLAEKMSSLSMQSTSGHVKSEVLESHKLARLINQPTHFRGNRKSGLHYRPTHPFKEWNTLSKRKRLEEENRLLQHAVQKYKTELTLMEASFLLDYQAVYADMSDTAREEVDQLHSLWNEVKGQVMEMEHLLMSRIKSVQAGNESHSLMFSLGIISKMVEVLKEQMYQQQLAGTGTREGRDRSLDDDIDIFAGEISYHDGRHDSFQATHSWLPGLDPMLTPRSVRRFHSSSTSNLPHDLNISLEQIKSSVLSQVQDEMKESTKKLELDLQEKDREIKKLQEQVMSRSLSLPEHKPRRWTPKPSLTRSHKAATKSRSHMVKENISNETDV